MPRSFWSGTLGFGLVAIPVRLYPASRRQDLSFKLLDRKNLSPVGYRRSNKTTGEEVPWERIVRGYEYEDDRYVVLTEQDFARANVAATQSIDILSFVARDAIHPVFYEDPYVIEPQKKASRSYALLREALERTGRIGVARVVLRTRQHLAAVIVWEGVLALDLLRYAHELVKPKELEVPESARGAKISAQELRMAERLIEDMVEERWNPARYRDEYRDDLMKLIEQRIESGQTHVIDESATGTRGRRRAQEVVDLMPLLKKSLAARGSRKDDDGQEPRASSSGRSASHRPRRGPGRARRTRHEERRRGRRTA